MLKRRAFKPILVGTPGRMWDMLSAFGQKPRCWPSNYRRPAAFWRAFFCRRGSRDLFFGGSLPILMDFVAGLGAGGGASTTGTAAADSFVSGASFRFAKCRTPTQLYPVLVPWLSILGRFEPF